MKKYEKIKFKILVPSIIVFSVIIILFIFGIFYLQEQNFYIYENAKLENAKKIFNHFLADEENILKSNLLHIAKDKKLQRLFLKKDKEKLIDYGISIYEKLNLEFQITHFYFINKNDTCFLRLHNTKRDGDKINRFTYKKAKEKKEIFSGIELGPYGTFALRMVYPWIVNNKIIGYIELGREIEHLIKKLKNVINSDFIFLIDKKFLKEKKWIEGLKMIKKENFFNWKDFENYAVIDNTFKKFDEIKNFLDMKNEKIFSLDTMFFHTKSTNLLDVQNQNVGKIIIINDITEKKLQTNNLIINLIIISFIIITILFFFFYFYIDKIEKFINVKIFIEIENRKKKEKLLKESNEEFSAINEEYKSQNEELTISKEKILNNEKLLMKLIQSYPNSFISIIKKDFKIKFISGRRFKKLKDPKTFKNIHIKRILKKEYNVLEEKFIDVFKGKEIEFEFQIQNDYFLYKIVPLKNSYGEINQILIIADNISRKKEKEKKLISLNENLKITNEKIFSSINYAKSIQNAILPSKLHIKQFLPENFIVFLPKDIVSGDFYWIKQIDNKILIAVADCTGHGVPGAFMSMIGIAYLNEITSKRNFHKSEMKANEILNNLRRRLKDVFYEGKDKKIKSDGMDMAFCILNLDNKKMQYSGANIPLTLMRKNHKEKYEIQNFKCDKMPIGHYLKEKAFKNNEIQLFTDDIIYMFSDGFPDQFGGEKNRKFMSKNLRNLLLKNCEKPSYEQKQIIENTFFHWKKDKKQIDDVLIFSFKILEKYGEVEFF